MSYSYVLTGKEIADNVELYAHAFKDPSRARAYAFEHFFLRNWQETKPGERWEIHTTDRTYLIERRKKERK